MHRRVFGAGLALALVSLPLTAQVDPRLYAGLTWRNLGPFRGGRIAAVSGAVGQAGVFYVGLPAAGVWKTTSAGQTWYPVFDAVKEVSSIGAVEVAPSDANVIYVGTGDLITGGGINEGNGVYKSADAGKTWRHLGLDATKQIPSILVDPRDPNVVMIAAQGDVHVKSDTRGVFRSTDGGATWTKTLYVDDTTGVQKLARANDVPNVVFATTVLHYTPPLPAGAVGGGFGGGGGNGPTATKVFKSTDGGVTWQELAGGGLPRLNGRTSMAVAMGTNAQRVFLTSNNGFYRSDDGGTTWRQMAAGDQRIRNGQGGYNCGVYVDPQNPDLVYVINTSSYRSTDGGNTFTGFKGAPGGDDPQQMWIDPSNGKRILLGLDQGAVVTLDGGDTWSSWYNQSTDQIYHLSTDNSSPYWVYGTQQDAGAIRTRVRGNLGAITPLDWNPVSGWEWGTIVPDPLDPNTVYASGSGILKISYPTEEWINVSPSADPSRRLRTTSSQPIIFAPWNQHMLIAAFQSVWSTIDGGAHWTAMSPDLGVRTDAPPTPSTAGGSARPPGGAIESMRGSTVAAGMLWVGTNNGLIKMTRDAGKTWQDASISGIPNVARAEVLAVEPSHFDAAEAYAVLDLHRQGDYAPYVYRTRDFGKTWTKIVDGLATNQPSGSFARVVRNDTKKKGLLFAGTESGMYVSFDDGEHWQSLQLNLPTTSYRDLAIKDNDLVAATYGRGFWVIDDYSMLRQVTPAIASETSHLFKPGDAVRRRRNVGADTPFPPEIPHALNPIEGVAIDYWLASGARELTIDVTDSSGALVRHLSNAAIAPVPEAARPPHPNFWVATPMPLSANSGENRAHWDLRYDSPPAFSHSFEINANPGLTPPSPEGPVAIAGRYTIKLTADGRSSTQTVAVRSDPHSPASASAISAQHALQMKVYAGLEASYSGHAMALSLQSALRAVPAGAQSEPGNAAGRASALATQLDTLVGLDAGRGRGGGGRGRGQTRPANFRAINGALVAQLNAQDNGDMAPTAATLAAFKATCQELRTVVTAWERLSG
ncbi:MAG: WD40/YVTN/BNR-like repeat-containing protein, partial [Gemmatimonadaceae bacterium]